MGDRTGLVLGGGGITGAAWEIGLIAGLAELGVDLTSADVVVGTSAGAVAGSQIRSGIPIEELYARQLEDPIAEVPVRLNPTILVRFVFPLLLPGDEQAKRARLGRAALRAKTISESKRRQIIASRLPTNSWPDQALLITAVDAQTGEFRVFDRKSGVPLVDAVAASCAAPLVYPAITIDGRRYVDGGVRSAANADLAKECDRVVVLAPLTAAFRKSQRIEFQLASLGPRVRSIVIAPDPHARQAMGRQALDPAYRAAAARAGKEQASRVVALVHGAWSDAKGN
jgi:NTE family protein